MKRESQQQLPLAIVGAGCRFAGADNLDEFWDEIRSQRCAIRELPSNYLDQSLYFDPRKGQLGKTYSKIGGVVRCGLIRANQIPAASELLEIADPVHLTFLDVIAEALERAHWEPSRLRGVRTGVYVGHARSSALWGEAAFVTHAEQLLSRLDRLSSWQEFEKSIRNEVVQQTLETIRSQHPPRDSVLQRDLETGRVASLAAEVFGCDGPAIAVDAACASAFLALAQAANALRRDVIDQAIVGGASHSNWYSLVMFSHAQALSPDGSFPFDERANGFVSSDGYAAILLKTLPKAIADGDRILGVIRGIGVSTDGRGKSLWAPRKEGQIAAIERAYGDDLDAETLGYVEAHGTSTRVGDATELEALSEELGRRLPAGRRIPVSSVKANIGHTRETAGLAGLLKTLMILREGVVPAATAFETPNPDIPWDRIPFFVPRKDVAWPDDGRVRRAAVDAFGIGGLNAHVVVDDRVEEAHKTSVSVPTDLLNSTDEAESIAVVGAGAIFPGARTINEFRKLIAAGNSTWCDVPSERWDAEFFRQLDPEQGGRVAIRRAGFVTDFEYDWRKHHLPPKQVECGDPQQFMLLDASDQAITDMGAGHSSGTTEFLTAEQRRRTSVVVGAMMGGDFSVQLNLALRVPELQKALRAALAEQGIAPAVIESLATQFGEDYLQQNRVLEDETGSYTSSTLASRLAKTLDVMGGAFTLDGAGVSSAAALACAFDQLLQRQVDLVVCAAGHRNMDVTTWEKLSARGWLQADIGGGTQQSGAVGAILGEGAGVVLLKRLSDARRDGDKVLAVLRGYGASCDQDLQQAVTKAAQRSVINANIQPHDIEYLELASPGVAPLDDAERQGLTAVFNNGSKAKDTQAASITPQIGFGQSVSGMAGLLRLTTAFADRRLPATPNSEPIRLPNGNSPIAAGLSSISLRPMAYHWIVQSERDAVSAPKMEPTTWRIARFSAESAESLLAALADAASDCENAWQAANYSKFSASDSHRLAIVSESAAELRTKLTLAQSQFGNEAARQVLEEQGVFIGAASGQTPRIAFIFSGQGSQYAGMFHELAAQSDVAAQALADLDKELRSLNLPTLADLAWNADADELGRDLFSTQLSVLLADTLAFRVLRAFGIRPDVISDHSYGEYAALVASGAWSLPTAIEATRRRCEIISSCESASGVLLSTSASCEEAERFLHEAGGEVFLANANAPDQTVLGGRADDIERLSVRIARAGFTTKVIPVPAPFHTPLMAECQPLFRAAVAELPIQPPSTPLLSSVTNRYVADPFDLRENLVEQFVRPVRFVELSQRLLADGCSLLIEVGPRQVVSRLLRRCVPSAETSIIAFDNPKRPGLEALLRVQALFEVRGGVSERASIAGTMIQHSRAPSPAQTKTARTPTRPIFFDATVARREKRSQSNETSAMTAAAASDAVATSEHADELQTLLVNFVCEQTGYPPELVAMDADLEADLGIDSIKKAQLLGELREQFVFQQPAGNLSLSDFPTLRHIYNFLKDSPRKQAGSDAPPSEAQQQSAASEIGQTQTAAAASAHELTPRVVPTRDRHTTDTESHDQQAWQRLNVAFFRGSRYEIGRLHGEHERDAIHKLVDAYANYFGGKVKELTPLEEALQQQGRFIPPEGLEELRGMADASGMPLPRLVAFNFGLGFEYVAGCSQIAIPARHNGRYGLIHAINEDLTLGLLLGDKVRRLVQVRHPDEGIPHVLFSTSGQLGAFNGFNQAGLCVTSTLLLDRFHTDVPDPGWIHSFVMQTILQQTDNIADAVQLLRGIRRCGAWSVCLSDRIADRLVYLEYDGDQLWERVPDEHCFFSTNHALLAEHLNPVLDGSRHRYERLEEIFRGNGHDGHSASFVQSILNDVYDRERGRTVRHPTMNTIRRSDTQASIVMCPGADEVWVTQNFNPGPDTPRDFTRLAMSKLFETAAQSADDEVVEQSAHDSRIMRRYVLRTAEQPLDAAPLGTWNLYGPVVVLGDGKLSTELSRRLAAGNLEVTFLPISGDAEAALAHFGRICAAECPMSIIVGDDSAASLDASCLPRAFTLFRVLQSWLTKLPAEQVNHGTLVGLTSIGADFGWTSPVLDHVGGGVAGLCKALQREFPELRVLVLDAPFGEPAPLIASALQKELDSESRHLEVSWVRQRRRVSRLLARDPRPVAGAAPRRNGTWVVTGGARGITFAVARELAKRYGLKLHLLGSSPAPQVDDAARQAYADDPKGFRTRTIREARQAGADPNIVWKNLERSLEIDRNLTQLEVDGISAQYHACDVSNADALARLLDQVRIIDGPIHGVLHGAGVEDGSKFSRKRIDRVAATLNVKVGGALHLIRLLANDPLEHFIGFGSISGRFGNVGQSDYSMASDWLAKIVGRLRAERPNVAATAFHWPAWDEVGMAARPESRVVLEAAGSEFLPLAEGCAYVIAELEAGCPEAEVLIVDHPQRFDLPGYSPAKDSQARLASEHRAREFPLLSGVRECSSDVLVAESRLDPARDVFLTEHQFAGTPILPAAVGMELLAEAASLLMGRDPTGLANVEIVNGLRFGNGLPQVVQVKAARHGDRVDCEVAADLFHRDGRLIDPQRVFVRGSVLFKPQSLTNLELPSPLSGSWKAMLYRTLDESIAQTSIYHGPAFRCLRKLGRDERQDGAWLARLEAPVPSNLCGARAGSRWLLPSVLLDGCFQLAGIARRVGQGTALSLPQGVNFLRWSRLPLAGEECLCLARFVQQDDRVASWMIELAMANGEVILELDRYRNVAAGASAASPNEPSGNTRAMKPANERASVITEDA